VSELRLEPDQDAVDFGLGLRELLADSADSAALRLAWDSDDGRVPGLWQQLAGLGVPALMIPAAYGGLGLDLRSAFPVLLEAGRAALPEPLVETMVGSAILAAAGGSLAQHWLPKVANGDAVIAVGVGPGELISAAPWADLLLLRDEAGVAHAVEAGEVALRAKPSVDRGMRLSTVDWQPSTATRIDDADLDAGFDLAAVAVAAQLLGLAEAMLDRSVAYAMQREQFGKVIGSFQAIKHQLADVYVGNAFARPVAARAAWSVARDRPTRSRDASHAKLAASTAAARAARTALQVHAGIGYTYEHDLHIWMKRTWSLTTLWGGLAWHRARVAAAVLQDHTGVARSH
jgi:alkylation response protein AidB-like acyl-CoA dehydrogenase